ncbi:MAG: RsmE family RNA methyltransferase [Halanaerobium sp.]
MYKFFINNNAEVGQNVFIDGNDYNHLKNSLRLNIGDRVILSDAEGFDMEAEIIKFNDQSVKLEIINKEKSTVEPNLKVYLAQALPKKSKMDFIVEKATEIGFKALIPLETKRTIVKYNAKKKEKKQDRWQRVAEAAAKQSGRAVIPDIFNFHSINSLKNFTNKFDYILVLWENEKEYSIKKFFRENIVSNTASILMIVGPEGGFSAEEVEQLKKELNAVIISLGARIMRTETAGITGLTCLLYEKGELGD